MREPAYSFTIPTLHDDLPVDCRLYLPVELPKISSQGKLRGAVVAHPYAPLGGSFDDSVVLSVKDTLLDIGYIVVTFNFRGAGESAGRTSWTGSPEIEDFTSVVGLLVYYLHQLQNESSRDSDILAPILSTSNPGGEPEDPFVSTLRDYPSVRMLLAGYSFGSLILARLPPVPTIVQRLESAEKGTADAEIILRAKTLAKQTHISTQETHRPSTPRGQSLTSPRARSSSIRLGGEETEASQRRRSRDSKRSVDVVRDVPNRIKTHIRRRSGSGSKRDIDESRKTSTVSTTGHGGPTVLTTYLLISPVLLPMTTILLPPGLPSTLALPFGLSTPAASGLYSWNCQTLLIFGTNDSFTSSKRLRQWATKSQAQSAGALAWKEVEDAGHFWREEGVMHALSSSIVSWDMENSQEAEKR